MYSSPSGSWKSKIKAPAGWYRVRGMNWRGGGGGGGDRVKARTSWFAGQGALLSSSRRAGQLTTKLSEPDLRREETPTEAGLLCEARAWPGGIWAEGFSDVDPPQPRGLWGTDGCLPAVSLHGRRGKGTLWGPSHPTALSSRERRGRPCICSLATGRFTSRASERRGVAHKYLSF